MKSAIGVCICALFFAAAAHADSVLVFDLTPSKGEDVGNRVYPLPNAPKKLAELLRKFSEGESADKATLMTALHQALAQADLRWITARGDLIKVYALYDRSTQKQPTIKFTEIERKTRLAEDLTTLAKIIGKVAELKDVVEIPIGVVRTEYRLTLTRAQLTVDTAADPLKEAADQKQIPATATLITGPTEHLFLSTDVPVDHIKDAKFDTAGHEVGLVDTPSTFYLGINFLIGDVFSDQRQWYGNFAIKPLLKISKQPLDSYGMAFGYRLPPLRTFGFELDTFSPFVGYIWNRQVGQSTSITKGHPRAGISFNLDKALGWIK